MFLQVWDRRTLHREDPVEVGALAGHTDGITHIDSKVNSTMYCSLPYG